MLCKFLEEKIYFTKKEHEINSDLAKESHKKNIRTFEKQKVHSLFIGVRHKKVDHYKE